MTRPRLFVELCCGSAAVSLRLLGGEHAKPPISYMGSKRGYAHAILGVLGLQSGAGADAVLLCDAGPWAVVWSTLSDPSRCAAVADTLRAWADEEPRALWERLRDEHRGTWDTWVVDGSAEVAAGADSVAGWLYSGHFSYRGGEPESGFCPIHTRRREPTATDHGANPRTSTTVADAVAAWLQVGAWSPQGKGWEAGYAHDCGTHIAISSDEIARRAAAAPPGLNVHHGSATDINPPDDCDGVFLYMDPPYQGTTGYTAEFPRDEVLEVARRWDEAGAVVCLSEAEPLPLDSWHHVDITSTRVGQKRTFSRQQAEWLTLNHDPQWRPMVQENLFGA